MERRRELHLGVEQLAGRMAVDPRQVRRIERGQANVTFETLAALASGLERLPSEMLAALERSLMLQATPGAAARTTPRRTPDDIPSTDEPESASPAPLKRTLGAAVATFRRHARLTQRELGDAAGLSLSAVQSVESGRHAPTMFTLEALARALRCEVLDLLGAHRKPFARRREAEAATERKA